MTTQAIAARVGGVGEVLHLFVEGADGARETPPL